MNYVREINAFYDRLEINPLSVSGIALWYALMHICNKAGWPVNFSVAVSVLSIKSGLKERTVYLARNELKQKGYIDFQSRKGNQSATYKMISLCLSFSNVSEDNHQYVSASHADSFSESDEPFQTINSSHNGEPLIKQKTTKQKDINKEAESLNPFVFYETNGFGSLSPTVIEDINYWLNSNTFSEPESIVIEAMRQAVMNNAKNWKYVSKVLIDWSNRKLTSLQDVNAYQKRWKKRNSNIATFNRKSKGHDEIERDKRRDRPNYTGYDFGF